MRTVAVFLLYASFLTAQVSDVEIDSLQALAAGTSNDTVKIKALLGLEYAYRFTDYKKGLEYADKALKMAKKAKWDKGIAMAYNNIGGSYLDRGEHAKALANYSKSLEFSMAYPKKRLTTLMNISNIYLREKNYTLANNYNKGAFKLAVEIKDTEEMAYAYYQFGLISREREKWDEATAFFKKSLKLFREHNNQFQIAEVTTFLGEVTQNYKQKLDYILKSKAIWDRLMPDYQSAVNNSILLSKTYIEIVKSDAARKESGVQKTDSQLLDEAEQLLIAAIKHSETSGIKQYLMDAYGVLAEVKALKNEYPAAYRFMSLHENLKDSIFSQESKNKIAALESAKEIARRDNEIKINRLTLKTKETEKWFLVLALGLLAVIGGLLYYQSRNRKKNNMKLQLLNVNLEQANRTKLRFLSILNHDLRSPVSSFIHYIQFKEENPELLDAESRQRIERKTVTSAKNLLHSMEDILVWAKDQMDNFKLNHKEFTVNELFESTKTHFLTDGGSRIRFENPENIALFTDENHLKTIIRNLTGNGLKATAAVVDPMVLLKAWTQDGTKFISVTDNGRGVAQEQLKSLYDENEAVEIQSGLGLHLIRDLAKSINCTITVSSEPGRTTFVLRLE